jgi:hypothetical protein
MRVPAILTGRRLARENRELIVVNGHGGDKHLVRVLAASYARAGAVVLTYDPAGEGERNIERKRALRTTVGASAELAERLGGLMMTDIMQAVST